MVDCTQAGKHSQPKSDAQEKGSSPSLPRPKWKDSKVGKMLKAKASKSFKGFNENDSPAKKLDSLSLLLLVSDRDRLDPSDR